MRIKSLAAALAASSLMLASTSAVAANPASALSLSSLDRASPAGEDESQIMDSGLMGVLIIFGAGVAVGALLYSLIKGGDEEPASP